MHITLDGYIYERQSKGGISRIYHEILPLMCELSQELTIDLWAGENLRQALPIHSKISPHIFPAPYKKMRPTRYFGRLQIQLRQFLLNRAVDLHCSIWHATYYTLPKERDAPTIISVYDMIQERFPDEFTDSLSRQVVEQKRKCAERGDAFACISESTRQDFIDFYGVPREKTHVIHLAHSPVFSQEPETASKQFKKPFLLYVGRRQGYKNFSGLLDAYAQWAYRAEVDLVTVGPSWQPEERQMLSHYSIQNSVHALTEVDDNLLRRLYNQAAAFVYPSYYEGFGIPLLEAMACGCPVVTSSIPVHREIGGEVPFYFELDKVESLTEALGKATSIPRSAPHVQKGLKRVKSFSWEQTAKSTLALYETFG